MASHATHFPLRALTIALALTIPPGYVTANSPEPLAQDPFAIGGSAVQPTTPAAASSAPAAPPAADPAAPTPASKPAATPASTSTAVQATPAPAARLREAAQSGRLESPILIPGNDQLLAPSKAVAPAAGSRASLRFENTAVGDVAHVVLREMAQVDYIVHPPLNGSVTLSTAGPVTVDQALYLLESALQANGLLMVRDPRGTYHIGRAEVLRNIVPGVRQASSSPLAPGNGAIVVQLQHIAAAEMATILRPLLPPDSLIRVDGLRNLLVLSGTRTQAEGWLDIVRTFDVSLLKGMSVGVFPLRYITARDIEAALQMLSGGAPAAAATTSAGAGASTATAAASPISSGLGAIRVLPMDRLGSVIVLAPRAALLEEAQAWIEKIDQPGLGGATESQLFVYPVQNGNAAHLASVLNGLFGTGNATPNNTEAATAPGLRPITTASGNNAAGTNTNNANRIDPAAGTRTAGGAASVTNIPMAGGLRVIADNVNNAILIHGNHADYRKLESALRRLDVPAAQVLIEASIIEVTLTDEMQYGLQWNFNEQRGSNTGLGQLLDGSGLGALANGFTYTLSNSTGQVRAALKALADKSLVRVISSPSLMVLDNHTASISVGNQQPVRTSTTVTDGGNVTTSIQYKDTGVSLSVTPQVNAGNMVAMTLNQSVTDVGGIDAATGQRAFLQRQVASKVAVRSGESIVLGGLIRDNDTTGKSGLPILKDIPVFGALFGTHTSNTDRTELLVVITPRVLRNDNELRDAGAELRERMERIQRFQADLQRKPLLPSSPSTPPAVEPSVP